MNKLFAFVVFSALIAICACVAPAATTSPSRISLKNIHTDKATVVPGSHKPSHAWFVEMVNL